MKIKGETPSFQQVSRQLPVVEVSLKGQRTTHPPGCWPDEDRASWGCSKDDLKASEMQLDRIKERVKTLTATDATDRAKCSPQPRSNQDHLQREEHRME